MVVRKKKSVIELKKQFLKRAWEILWSYMERLSDAEVIEHTDSRGSATVVKTLFEAINRAQENVPDQEVEIELPEIPEAALDEALRICFPELLPSPSAARTRRKRTGVSDRPPAAPPA